MRRWSASAGRGSVVQVGNLPRVGNPRRRCENDRARLPTARRLPTFDQGILIVCSPQMVNTDRRFVTPRSSRMRLLR